MPSMLLSFRQQRQQRHIQFATPPHPRPDKQTNLFLLLKFQIVSNQKIKFYEYCSVFFLMSRRSRMQASTQQQQSVVERHTHTHTLTHTNTRRLVGYFDALLAVSYTKNGAQQQPVVVENGRQNEADRQTDRQTGRLRER